MTLHAFVQTCLTRWPLPANAELSLANVSENTTFRVRDPSNGRQWALRVHRVGYHSLTAIRSELAWIAALRAEGVAVTPTAVAGHDGELVQFLPTLGRAAVLFAWEAGEEPTVGDAPAFALMGETAARMHRHVLGWHPPAWFERHTWNFQTSLGPTPRWGRWRNGPGMTGEIASVFQRTCDVIERRLAAFGQDKDRFGLVHGDMRLANLLLDGRRLKVLDFDDSGYSWFLYDAATTVSFFEHRPEVPDLLAAWAAGYRRVRPLSASHEAEIATFVMLRRLLLIAWLGSRPGTLLAQELGPDYTLGAVPMCEDYLRRMEQ